MSVFGLPIFALTSARATPAGPEVDEREFIGQGGGGYQDLNTGGVDAGDVGDRGADEGGGGRRMVGLLGGQREMGCDKDKEEVGLFHVGFSDVLSI